MSTVLPSLVFFMFSGTVNSQYFFEKDASEKISLHPYASIVNLRARDLPFTYIIENYSKLGFKPVGSENKNLGFTQHNFWVSLALGIVPERSPNIMLKLRVQLQIRSICIPLVMRG